MCIRPIPCFFPINVTDMESKQIKFYVKPSQQKNFREGFIPCTKCPACEGIRSVKTAMQLACELKTNSNNCWFVTFTYDNEHLPDDYCIEFVVIQKHVRAMRRHLNKIHPFNKFKYLIQCEYGGLNNRPHYHLVIYDYPIDDLCEIEQDNGTTAFESDFMTQLWGKGSVHIMPLHYGNIVYVTQHHYKDRIDNKVKIHLLPVVHPVTGEYISERLPEKTTRSLRPAIGDDFFNQYFTDIYPHDYLIQDDQKMPVPRRFDTLLERKDPDLYDLVKETRKLNLELRTDEENDYQLKYIIAKIKSLKPAGK